MAETTVTAVRDIRTPGTCAPSPGDDQAICWLDRCPSVWRRPFQAGVWVGRLIWDGVWLSLVLGILASFPVGNLFVFGYLLEVEGRIAAGEQVRRAWPLLPLAGRCGTVLIGFAIWLVPLALLIDLACDAWFIAPASVLAWCLAGAAILLAVVVTGHLSSAILQGGNLLSCFRPLKNLGMLRRFFTESSLIDGTAHAVGCLIRALALPLRMRLGVQCFACTLLWISPAMFLFTSLDASLNSTALRWQQWMTLLGAALLLPLLLWLPLLQVHFAREQRWRAMFEVSRVRNLFRRAPWAFTIAIVLVYVLSIPLYLYWYHVKMRMPPHTEVWDLAWIIVVTCYPGRIATAWAYRRATQQPTSWAPWSWLCRIGLVVLMIYYLQLLWHARMIGNQGAAAMYLHHSLVIPFFLK